MKNRPLQKLAEASEIKHQAGAQSRSVHEDSSTALMLNFAASIEFPKRSIDDYKHLIREIKQQAVHAFQKQEPIQKITKNLVKAIDSTLVQLFHQCHLHTDNRLTLLSIGGYGRRELQLHSDIDLLILYQDKLSPEEQQRVEHFIQLCWDMGLEISHQLTHPHDCAALAAEDVTIISSLLDMRLLCGNATLLEELQYLTHPLHMWGSHTYFIAKQQEQQQRYTKYNETAYNLEPNIKNGPGGLRDIHVLLHVAKRHFKIKKFSEGIMHGFLTEKDFEELIHCRRFLWRVRFALHWCAEKKEDKLLFDYQSKIAPFLNYQDTSSALAIELFMKDYFKIIKRTRELNDILLQWLSESIVSDTYRLISLDAHFQLANHHIEVKSPTVFKTHPEKLLTLFLWMTKLPEIQGVRASTIRLIHQSTYLINQAYRNNPLHHQQFLEIFKSPNGPYQALRHMNRYGVLGHYLPCFQQVIGQMQYDLFHIYTVDQHALFVIRHITRYQDPIHNQSYALCARLMKSIPKSEILYLSALFHDIAKGRGGDHSELGAEDALQFAQQHGLSVEDRDLLVWLVRHHLLLSHTVQRKDIYDPMVIAEFCQQLPQSHYLDYLYLLTVADICGTNAKLWNSWKDSLLKELYYAAKLYLHQDEGELNNATLISERQTEALALLRETALAPSDIQALWQKLNHRYFTHEPPTMIAAHTQAILSATHYPVILIQPHHSDAAMELFIYMPHQDERFAITTAVLSNCHVTIQEANILTNAHEFDLDTYVILDENNPSLMPSHKIQLIQQQLTLHLSQKKRPRLIKQRMRRLHAHFHFVPQISFQHLQHQPYTQLLFIASDRPGLLAHLSQIFLQHRLHVHHAKIATAGERAEDTFSITNTQNQPLSVDEQNILRKTLLNDMEMTT